MISFWNISRFLIWKKLAVHWWTIKMKKSSAPIRRGHFLRHFLFLLYLLLFVHDWLRKHFHHYIQMERPNGISTIQSPPKDRAISLCNLFNFLLDFFFAIFSSKVRNVPLSSTFFLELYFVSSMSLEYLQMSKTVGILGSAYRLTNCCIARIILADSTIGSIHKCGDAPCPPFPITVYNIFHLPKP